MGLNWVYSNRVLIQEPANPWSRCQRLTHCDTFVFFAYDGKKRNPPDWRMVVDSDLNFKLLVFYKISHGNACYKTCSQIRGQGYS